MEIVIVITILALMFVGIREFIRFLNGYTKGNIHYDRTQIQYVDKDAFIEINKEWFRVLNSTSRYAATMKVCLEHEITRNPKEIVVSPEFWVKYKVYQSV